MIPVHTLNPNQVVTDLYTLIPPGAKMNTSDAGNSVIMTGRQADIRRFAQIISALDSTGNGDLQVFLLNLRRFQGHRPGVEGCFHGRPAPAAQGGGGNPFAAFVGGRGGRGGGGGGGGAAGHR